MNENKPKSTAKPDPTAMELCFEAFSWLAREIKKNRLQGTAIVLHTLPNRLARRSKAA